MKTKVRKLPDKQRGKIEISCEDCGITLGFIQCACVLCIARLALVPSVLCPACEARISILSE